jgi:tryptophan-rich hypothetical protein
MKKLLHSKWTSTNPKNKEKHFVVIKVNKNNLDAQIIDSVVIQAVMTKREFLIPPKELLSLKWSIGWL